MCTTGYAKPPDDGMRRGAIGRLSDHADVPPATVSSVRASIARQTFFSSISSREAMRLNSGRLSTRTSTSSLRSRLAETALRRVTRTFRHSDPGRGKGSDTS